MKKYGIIYLIRNKVNGKMYIGQTTEKEGFNGRYWIGSGKHNPKIIGIARVFNHYSWKRKHKEGYNEHLLNSIEKYGFEAFEVDECFDVAYSKEELNGLEYMYIKIYNLTNPQYGYNNKDGGGNGKPSEQTRKKISDKAKGRYVGENNPFYGCTHSKETRALISKKLKGKMSGKNNPMYGNSHSEETKNKISKSLVGKMSGKNNPMYGVHRIEKDAPCWGKNKSEDSKKKQSEAMKGKYEGSKNPRAKAVYCYELNKIRLTAKEWSEELNLNNSAIGMCCRGERKSTGGYHFRYATQEEIEEYLKQQNKDNNGVA